MAEERPLSLAYYVPGWPPDLSPNGITSYAWNIREGLDQLGHRVSLIAGRSAPGPHPGLATIHHAAATRQLLRLWWKLRLGPAPAWVTGRAIARSAREIKERSGLDLIEMEESFGWAEAVRRRAPAPVVVRLHGPWFLNGEALGVPEDRDFHRRVRDEGRALANARLITAPSADVLGRTRNYYGLPLDGAEVIPNPIQIPGPSSLWDPASCDPDRILFVGRFDRHKGGDIVIDAFASLAAEWPGARLLFAGPDRSLLDDQGRRWSLAEYAAARLDEQASRRFEWLGPVPHDRLDGLRRGAMVTVVASRYENFPTVVLEAKAQGCPLVAPRTGGIAEMVRDGIDGLLFNPGDAADMAAKLALLRRDPALAEALGREAAMDARARFSSEVVAARMAGFYRRGTGRGTPPPVATAPAPPV